MEEQKWLIMTDSEKIEFLFKRVCTLEEQMKSLDGISKESIKKEVKEDLQDSTPNNIIYIMNQIKTLVNDTVNTELKTHLNEYKHITSHY